MAAEYLKEIKECLEVSDSETFKDIFFDYRNASLPECLNIVFESVMDYAEFIIVVEEAGSFDGLKEIMENITEATGTNLLIDDDGREPDIESLSLQKFKDALAQKFDSDNFRIVKERIVSEFLMPEILQKLFEYATNECVSDARAKELLKDAGWVS